MVAVGCGGPGFIIPLKDGRHTWECGSGKRRKRSGNGGRKRSPQTGQARSLPRSASGHFSSSRLPVFGGVRPPRHFRQASAVLLVAASTYQCKRHTTSPATRVHILQVTQT